MLKTRVLMVFLAALGTASACTPTPTELSGAPQLPADSIESALTAYPNSTFYIVTRPDTRRCAYPFCGGFFSNRVNLGDAVCSDGTTQKECRILEFDYTALGLDPGTRDKLAFYAEKGQALLRGTITKTAPIAGQTYDKLVVKEAWVGRALATPSGTFSRVRQLPIKCLGCPTFQQERLNLTAVSPRFHSLVFDPKGWPAALVSELQAATARRDEGVLFAGTVSSSAGRQLLTVAEAYTPFPAYRGHLGDSCGSRGLPSECDDGLFCKHEADCGRTDLPGTCVAKPEFCLELYKPVCGCDKVTYGNDCDAGTAGMSVDYSGVCL